MKVIVLTIVATVGSFVAITAALPFPSGDASSVAIAQTSDTDINSDNGQGQVMYSYAGAVVGDGGKPVISQLTIAKGKDGDFHYARNENGTTKTGKWKGPLPSSPDLKALHDNVNNITKEFVDPLAILNQSIGDTVQQYIFEALKNIY